MGGVSLIIKQQHNQIYSTIQTLPSTTIVTLDKGMDLPSGTVSDVMGGRTIYMIAQFMNIPTTALMDKLLELNARIVSLKNNHLSQCKLHQCNHYAYH